MPRAIWRPLIVALMLLAIPATHAAQEPAAASPSARTWIGHEAAMESYLATAEVVRLEDIGTGVTRPRQAFLKPGGPFESLAWKVLPPGRRSGYYESYKSEIAAYQLDKLLEMHMVPPAVEREIDGQVGAAIMWLEGTRSVKEMGGKVPTGPTFGRPIRMMQMFDNLIGNIDRNAGNILVDRAGDIVLIDHSRAFIEKQDLPWSFERVDADLWEKLKALTAERLSGAIGQWVDRTAIDAMLKRRDRMTKTVDKLVAKKGAAVVIVR
jgi:hypothetical protein